HKKPILEPLVEFWTPGKAKPRFKPGVVNRDQVLGSSASAGKRKRGNRYRCRHVTGNRRGGCDSQTCGSGPTLRVRQDLGLGDVGPESALQIILFGARELQRVSQAEVERQIRFDPPV